MKEPTLSNASESAFFIALDTPMGVYLCVTLSNSLQDAALFVQKQVCEVNEWNTLEVKVKAAKLLPAEVVIPNLRNRVPRKLTKPQLL